VIHALGCHCGQSFDYHSYVIVKAGHHSHEAVAQVVVFFMLPLPVTPFSPRITQETHFLQRPCVSLSSPAVSHSATIPTSPQEQN
jgi:hypothetical protein